jgi:hypothetical protein
MKFIVPDEIGSSLRVLPNDTYEAEIQKIMFGESSTKNPKVTLKLIIQSEPTENDGEPTIGEAILETCSLQPQAMWKLNDWYKGATGERLPAGDFDQEDFLTMLDEALIGSRWNILVETKDINGEERSQIDKFHPIKSKKGTIGKKVKR